jgi:hypothetical protein
MAWANATFTNSWGSFNLSITGPSPFNTTSVSTGIFNPEHTSTATLIYNPQSIPTPWPVLASGYIVSLIGTLWILKDYFQKGEAYAVPDKGFTIKTWWNIGDTSYQAYRIIVAVRKAIQSVHNPLIPTQDLYQLEFMGLALAKSSFIDIFYNAPRVNAYLKIVISVISILVAIPAYESALRVVHRDSQYYSRWQLVGGNCPLVVGSCQHLEYVGCGINATTGIALRDPNIINTSNYLRIWEYIGGIGTLIVWPIVIIWTVITYIIVATEVLEARAAAKRDGSAVLHAQLAKHPAMRRVMELVNVENSREMGRMFLKWVPGFFLAIIVQAVPGIVLTVIQQQRPKSIFVVDSFGPLAHAPTLLPAQNYTGGNATSWSDCFEIHAPSDKWGFTDYWINSTGIVQKLALL